MQNFGGNLIFQPKHFYKPKTEEEVLEILNKHKKGKIRAVGSFHAWSDAVLSEDVLIDLTRLNKVDIDQDSNGDSWVNAGGGCVLKRLTNILNKKGLTMPALGAIQRQTIAGTISTGTHGSGNNSISHHIQEIRMAAYDKNGQAKIYEIKEGDELRAARCSVGCMGVILSVKFKCPKEYWVEEKTTLLKNISDVLKGEKEYPLQQFGLIPFRWEYFAYQRRVTQSIPEGINSFRMALLKAVDFFATEILTHSVIKVLAVFSDRGSKGGAIKWFYKDFIASLVNQRTVAYKSITALTLHTSHHDAFQHLEMEVFIPENHITRAAEFIRWTASVFSGESDLPENVVSDIKRVGMHEKLLSYKGHYIHHYPFFFRRIFPDDTLISMTSGDQIYYSVSFFVYLPPDQRERFYTYADFMAELLNKLFDARLHWGKYFPLTNKEIDHLYPRLAEFRQICRSVDPDGVFVNEFAQIIMGF